MPINRNKTGISLEARTWLEVPDLNLQRTICWVVIIKSLEMCGKPISTDFNAVRKFILPTTYRKALKENITK